MLSASDRLIVVLPMDTAICGHFINRVPAFPHSNVERYSYERKFIIVHVIHGRSVIDGIYDYQLHVYDQPLKVTTKDKADHCMSNRY